MCIQLLITVSRLPPTIAVTVIVMGEPAIALAGAVMLRVACVPQPNVSNPAKAAMNSHNRSAPGTLYGPPRADLPKHLASTGAEPAFALDNLSSITAVGPTRPSDAEQS